MRPHGIICVFKFKRAGNFSYADFHLDSLEDSSVLAGVEDGACIVCDTHKQACIMSSWIRIVYSITYEKVQV